MKPMATTMLATKATPSKRLDETARERRRRVVETIRTRREMMSRRIRRRKMPAQQEPRGITRDYARFLFRMLNEVLESLGPLLEELPSLARSAQADRGDSARMDRLEGRRVQELIDEAMQRFERTRNRDDLERVLEEFGDRIDRHQRAQLLRQIRAVMGVEVPILAQGVPAIVEGFVTENTSLIKKLTQEAYLDVESMVTRALQQGETPQKLTKRVRDRVTETYKNRARVIARYQMGKLSGQINRTQQKALGVTQYEWRTTIDGRERESHRRRNGDRFSWDDPPPDGHPGQAIQCRCWGAPVLDDMMRRLGIEP